MVEGFFKNNFKTILDDSLETRKACFDPVGLFCIKNAKHKIDSPMMKSGQDEFRRLKPKVNLVGFGLLLIIVLIIVLLIIVKFRRISTVDLIFIEYPE